MIIALLKLSCIAAGLICLVYIGLIVMGAVSVFLS